MGPNGVLTEIFNVVKDKVQDQYKEDVKKVNHDMSQAQQDMTPGKKKLRITNTNEMSIF